jgi:hypothetical protein
LGKDDYLQAKDDIIQQCIDKDKNGKTYGQIGDPYGLDGEAVRSLYRRWKKKNTKDINVDNKVMPENNIFNKIKIERQKLNQEKQDIRKFVKKFANFELIIEELQEGINRLPSLPYKSTYKIDNTNKELIAMLSDIHYGEQDSVEPINEYNFTIIEERLVKYFSEIKNIATNHNIKKINVCILGDLVTNFNIFKSQLCQTDKDIISQIIQLSEILSRLINDLSNEFTINIHYVMGNHGRVSYDLASSTNYERIIIEFIKLRLKDNVNINFNDSNELWDILSVFQYNYLLIHGDQLSEKNSSYRLKEIIGNLGIDVTEILSAHKHHSTEDEIFSNGFGILSNGSIIGGNSYSFRKLMVMSKSSQTVFVMEDGIGRTATYRVRLN